MSTFLIDAAVDVLDAAVEVVDAVNIDFSPINAGLINAAVCCHKKLDAVPSLHESFCGCGGPKFLVSDGESVSSQLASLFEHVLASSVPIIVAVVSQCLILV